MRPSILLNEQKPITRKQKAKSNVSNKAKREI